MKLKKHTALLLAALMALMTACGSAQEADLETILAADAAARAFVREHYSK